MLPDSRKRTAATLSAAVALLLSAALVAVWQLNAASVVKAPQSCGNCQGNNGNGGGNGAGTGSPGKALTAAATNVTPIAPGHAGTVTVRVDNPNNLPVEVTRMVGRVTGVGTRGLADRCDEDWIVLGDITGPTWIDKLASGTVTMPVTFTDLAQTNQDDCKGVAYTFSFTVYGHQA